MHRTNENLHTGMNLMNSFGDHSGFVAAGIKQSALAIHIDKLNRKHHTAIFLFFSLIFFSRSKIFSINQSVRMRFKSNFFKLNEKFKS